MVRSVHCSLILKYVSNEQFLLGYLLLFDKLSHQNIYTLCYNTEIITF